MQLTQTFSGSRISRRAAAIVMALVAIFLLAGASLYMAKAPAVGRAIVRTGTPAAVTQSGILGSDFTGARRGGPQVEGDAPIATDSAAGTTDPCLRVAAHVKGC